MSYSVQRFTKADVHSCAPGQPAEVGLSAVLNSQTQDVVSVQVMGNGDVVLVTKYVAAAPKEKAPSK